MEDDIDQIIDGVFDGLDPREGSTPDGWELDEIETHPDDEDYVASVIYRHDDGTICRTYAFSRDSAHMALVPAADADDEFWNEYGDYWDAERAASVAMKAYVRGTNA